MFASIEVENEFESIEVHGHYPGQTSLVFCWKIVDQDILEKAVARYKYYKRVRMVGPRSNHGVIINFINKLKRDPKRLEILGNGTQKNPTSTSKTLSTQLST